MIRVLQYFCPPSVVLIDLPNLPSTFRKVCPFVVVHGNGNECQLNRASESLDCQTG